MCVRECVGACEGGEGVRVRVSAVTWIGLGWAGIKWAALIKENPRPEALPRLGIGNARASANPSGLESIAVGRRSNPIYT